MRRKTMMMTGVKPVTKTGEALSFTNVAASYMSNVKPWTPAVYGAALQSGTPAVDSPVPIQCVKTGSIIKIAQAGSTDFTQYVVPCDLYEDDVWYPETGVVIHSNKLLVLSGDETGWFWSTSYSNAGFAGLGLKLSDALFVNFHATYRCSHFIPDASAAGNSRLINCGEFAINSQKNMYLWMDKNNIPDLQAGRAYLAAQSANGTPVTVVYQLAAPYTQQYPVQKARSYDSMTITQIPSDNGLPGSISAGVLVKNYTEDICS